MLVCGNCEVPEGTPAQQVAVRKFNYSGSGQEVIDFDTVSFDFPEYPEAFIESLSQEAQDRRVERIVNIFQGLWDNLSDIEEEGDLDAYL